MDTHWKYVQQVDPKSTPSKTRVWHLSVVRKSASGLHRTLALCGSGMWNWAFWDGPMPPRKICKTCVYAVDYYGDVIPDH